MSRLVRDGTAEPVSRDQILRHARGQGNIIFPVQLTTSRIGNLTRLIHTLLYLVCDNHTYIHTYPPKVGVGRPIDLDRATAVLVLFCKTRGAHSRRRVFTGILEGSRSGEQDNPIAPL